MREQVCKYMCPYARFQSAMFDRDTLIIAYDPRRGEPRGRRGKGGGPRAAQAAHRPVDQAHGHGSGDAGEQVHAPGHRAERHHLGPEEAEQAIQRLAGGMDEGQQRRGILQLAYTRALVLVQLFKLLRFNLRAREVFGFI